MRCMWFICHFKFRNSWYHINILSLNPWSMALKIVHTHLPHYHTTHFWPIKYISIRYLYLGMFMLHFLPHCIEHLMWTFPFMEVFILDRPKEGKVHCVAGCNEEKKSTMQALQQIYISSWCMTHLTSTEWVFSTSPGWSSGVIQWRCLQWDRSSQCFPCSTAEKPSCGTPEGTNDMVTNEDGSARVVL